MAGVGPPKHNTTPDFVRKLYAIMEEEENFDSIIWSPTNDSLVVKDPQTFAFTVLPKHFKHNKFSSFVRQLNKHNFHRTKLPTGHTYGEQACEYRHPMFQRGRRDLLEQISRQPSTVVSKPIQNEDKSESQSSLYNNTERDRMNGHLESLEQGQRLTFYQIKELERRIDYFERELGSCRYLIESQSRLIRDLLVSFPNEVRKHPDVASLTTELQQHWHEPGFDPYPYHPSNYRSTYREPHIPVGQNRSASSSTPSGNSANGPGNGPAWNGNGTHTSSNGSNGTTYTPGQGSANSNDQLGYTSTNGPIQNHLPFPNRQQHQPFNNQWNQTNEAQGDLQRRSDLASLNILILLSHEREQKLLSDLLLELNCLSFKFAVDMDHVFHCIDGKNDYQVVVLDKGHQNHTDVGRLRTSNPRLMVVFLMDQQEPTPPLEDSNIHTLTKPPTIHTLRNVLGRYILAQ